MSNLKRLKLHVGKLVADQYKRIEELQQEMKVAKDGLFNFYAGQELVHRNNLIDLRSLEFILNHIPTAENCPNHRPAPICEDCGKPAGQV